MTIKQFIEKAIEGSWKLRGADIDVFRVTMQLVDVRLTWKGDQYSKDGEEQTVVAIEVILLDPLAWQAVGKVGGFKITHDSGCDSFSDYCTHPEGGCNCELCDCDARYEWKVKMHEMIDTLAEGQSISEFIKTL